MNFRTQAIEEIGEFLRVRVPEIKSLEIVAAPPSKSAVYPAMAILIDRTEYWINDDYIPVDASNNPLVGPDATSDAPADWGRFDDDTLIYRVGRYVLHGRIFVATRHPDQRTELEEAVFAAFFEDDLAPGRILVNVEKPVVLGRELPWKWPVAAFLSDAEGSSWSAEFAFDERLWSWIKFDVDVDIFAPRNAPKLTTMVLQMDVDVTQPTLADGTVADTDSPDDESILVTPTGTTNYTP